MYNNLTPAAGAGGMLAVTGVNSLWLFLAAFAMIALGAAIWRITPRKQAAVREGHWS